MCNYMTVFSLKSYLANLSESFVMFSHYLLSYIATEFTKEDDNRGSGR